MFRVGCNFRRCQFKFRDLIRVSEKLSKDQPNPDLEKCKGILEKLYDTCTKEEESYNTTVEMSTIIHLQQLVMIAGFNLLINQEEGEKLDLDPIPLHINLKKFATGCAFENLEYILRRLVYTDLHEELAPLQDQDLLIDKELLKVIDLQRETIDRILRELHCIARKRLSDQ